MQKSGVRVAGIATMKGRENELINTVNSLLPQVDWINVYFNYETEPLNLPKVFSFIHPLGDLGDIGKFFDIPPKGIYFACDDDLIYPKGYCDYLQSKAEQYKCPVSLHGKFISTPVNSYYRSGIKFRCLDSVDSDIEVNVIGTGTLCFRTEDIKISIEDFETKNMADIWFSVAAKKQGIKLMVTEHKKGWIKYQQVSNTIHEAMKNNDSYQTKIVNQYL